LSLGIGLIVPGSTAQSQGWRTRESQRNERRSERQVRQEIHRDRQQDRHEAWRREARRDREEWRDREQRRAWELERERERPRALLERQRRVYRTYPYAYRNYGYYGNNGYSGEAQKGYRDGLNRGREDAQTRRIADPNNSSHYRSGNAAYREGFNRGYFIAYRQYR